MKKIMFLAALAACDPTDVGGPMPDGGTVPDADARPTTAPCKGFECPPSLQTCVSMGCDGTQNVPLYCPAPGEEPEQPEPGACWCAAPNGPDGWCVP